MIPFTLNPTPKILFSFLKSSKRKNHSVSSAYRARSLLHLASLISYLIADLTNPHASPSSSIIPSQPYATNGLDNLTPTRFLGAKPPVSVSVFLKPHFHRSSFSCLRHRCVLTNVQAPNFNKLTHLGKTTTQRFKTDPTSRTRKGKGERTWKPRCLRKGNSRLVRLSPSPWCTIRRP